MKTNHCSFASPRAPFSVCGDSVAASITLHAPRSKYMRTYMTYKVMQNFPFRHCFSCFFVIFLEFSFFCQRSPTIVLLLSINSSTALLQKFCCSPTHFLHLSFAFTETSSPQRFYGEPSLSHRRALAISITSPRQLVKSKGAPQSIHTCASGNPPKRFTKKHDYFCPQSSQKFPLFPILPINPISPIIPISSSFSLFPIPQHNQ